MKRRKILSFLLGITLAFPNAAISAFADEEETQIPQEHPRLYAAPADYRRPAVSAHISAEEEAALPDHFDLRDLGLVSGVRDQGSLGTCWAHATIGCLETAGIRENPYIDLSERHLASYVTSETYGDFSMDLNKGNRFENALGLMSNWIGPVSESLAPYDEELETSPDRKEIQRQSEMHITGARNYNYFQLKDSPEYWQDGINGVKHELMTGHALYLALEWTPDLSGNVYNVGDFFSGEDFLSPHAVLIIGYDDNFDADNFETPPPGDGAWIVKNSYGIFSGQNGYCYVSYFDHSLNEIACLDAVSANLHDTLYSCDDYGINGMFSINPDGDETAYLSNVYTAEENGYVTDVMLFSAYENDAYEISVYTGLTEDGGPESGEAHAATVGTAQYFGYQTVTLDEPVQITAGERFAVVAKMSGETGTHITCEYSAEHRDESIGFGSSAPYSSDASSYELITEARINETFAPGQSYFSADGEHWTDVNDCRVDEYGAVTGNFCLRAMASTEGTVHFSSYSETLAPGAELALSCADGSDIYCSLNGSDYMLYDAPITFSGDLTVSAYVDGFEDNVFTRHYAEKKAGYSTMAVKEYSADDYNANGGYIDPAQTDIEMTVAWNTFEIGLIPGMTGTLTDGEKVIHSSEEARYECGLEPFTVKLTAKEDGLSPTVYTYRFSRECPEQMSECVVVPPDRSEWYYFSYDGKSGSITDRITGEKTDFTYEIADHQITFTFEDSVRTAKFASNGMDCIFEWEDGQTVEYRLNRMSEDEPFITNPKLIEMAKEYALAVYGFKAEKAEISTLTDNEYEATMCITLTSKKGKKLTFTVSDASGCGRDQDGNVVTLADIPENTGISSLCGGIWASQDQSGVPSYFYFSEDTDECAVLDFDTGEIYKGTYTLENGHFTMQTGDDDPRCAAVTIYEDHADFIWGGSFNSVYYENFTYFSDDTMDTFHPICCNELKRLGSEYYEAENCKLLNIDFCYRYDDTHLALNAFESEQPYIYLVDWFTGLGTDLDGNPVDLRNPEVRSDFAVPAGIYFSIDESKALEGYYWFSEDGKTACFRSVYMSEPDPEITIRILGENGIADWGYQKKAFTINEMGPGYVISWQSSGTSEMITRKKAGTKDDLNIYSLEQLSNMTYKDYTQKHHADIALNPGYDEDGNVVMHIYAVNEPEEKELAVYTIDPETGTGTDQNGDPIDLPQTGSNSADTLLILLGALGLIGAGFCIIRRSGILRRKPHPTE